MDQLGLTLEAPRVPMARSGDPRPSHDAANRHEARGRRAAEMLAVLDALTRFPGSTSKELAAHAGMERSIPGRRLPELEAAGRARCVAPSFCPDRPERDVDASLTPCAESGIKSLRWWPMEGR